MIVQTSSIISISFKLFTLNVKIAVIDLILRNYLVKEVFRTASAVFIVVFLILLSTQLLRVLSAVSEGKITLDLLFVLLGLMNLESMTLVLPLVLYLSIILALSRLYKDSEMIAMWACGISPKVIIKSLFPIIIVFVGIELFFAMSVNPWANDKITLLKNSVEATADVDMLDNGRFNSFSNGDRVVYIEDTKTVDDNDILENVFVRIRNGKQQSVVYAKQAKIEKDPKSGARYIVFINGNRYDGVPGASDYKVVHFHEYGVLMMNKSTSTDYRDEDARSLKQLWEKGDARSIAELQWRVSMVFSVLILSLMAIPVSKTSPRKGRYSKVLPAVLIYFLYSNLLSISQNLVKKEDLPAWIGMWWVHLLFLALFVWLLGQQMGWFQTRFKRDNV